MKIKKYICGIWCIISALQGSEEIFKSERLSFVELKNGTPSTVMATLICSRELDNLAFSSQSGAAFIPNVCKITAPQGWLVYSKNENGETVFKTEQLVKNTNPKRKSIINFVKNVSIAPEGKYQEELPDHHFLSGCFLKNIGFVWRALNEKLFVELRGEKILGPAPLPTEKNPKVFFPALNSAFSQRYPELSFFSRRTLLQIAFNFLEREYFEYLSYLPGQDWFIDSPSFKEVLAELIPQKLSVTKLKPLENRKAVPEVAMVTMVKDESKIIFENLFWHYVMGMRKFVVIDNGSNDRTLARINVFKKLFSDAIVIVLKDDRIEYRQSSRMNAAIYIAEKVFPDVKIIFPLDADEFVCSDKPLSALLNEQFKWGYFPRFTYMHGAEKGAHFSQTLKNLQIKSPYGYDDMNPAYGKCFFRSGENFSVNGGNHFAHPNSNVLDGCVNGYTLGFHIREYPLRSAAHAVRKVVNNGEAILSLPEDRAIGWHHAQENYVDYIKNGDEYIRRDLKRWTNESPDLVEELPLYDMICRTVAVSVLREMNFADYNEYQDFHVNKLEIVVARYNEDLSWLRQFSDCFKITVYNKGQQIQPFMPNMTVIDIKNVGRESHTYLTHVVNCYGRFAPFTLFIQGNPSDHIDPTFFEKIHTSELRKPDYALSVIGANPIPYSGLTLIEHCKNLTPADFKDGPWKNTVFNPNFPTIDDFAAYCGISLLKNGQFAVSYGAQFIVSNQKLMSRSVGYYEKILGTVSNSTAPIEGHFFERIWDLVFDGNLDQSASS
ncbi:MAG: hypothetical protein NEHIOOID_00850 [Holosporales bacterium]